MAESPKKLRVNWYRSPVSRQDLKRLNQRSDFKGFAQTLGYLGLLVLTGTAASVSVGRLPWPVVVVLFFFHGTCSSFLINGFHELVHDSVFKTQWLNRFFLRIFSFLGWYNHHFFWASHMEHHKYTLHPPDDLEVVLPTPVGIKSFLLGGSFIPRNFVAACVGTIKTAMGKLSGQWENALFPADKPLARKRLFRWARILLVGHVLMVIAALYFGLWQIILAVTLCRFYGNWLHYLCNNTQHAGLSDNVSDFRICCRTITLSPFVQFLYWHMNFHTEHHMYAAVPCYHLGKLHKLIKADLPACPHGLVATWKQILQIAKRQKSEPGYQFVAALPDPSTATVTAPQFT